MMPSHLLTAVERNRHLEIHDSFGIHFSTVPSCLTTVMRYTEIPEARVEDEP